MLWVAECLKCGEQVTTIPAKLKTLRCRCEGDIDHCKVYKKYSGKSFAQWCKENGREDYLEAWDYDLNVRSPDEVGYGSSSIGFWFCCPNHNESHGSRKYTLSNLTVDNKNHLYCKKCNSIASWLIAIYGDDALNAYWDWDLNELDPWEIDRGSAKKVYLKCPSGEHQSFSIACNNLIRHSEIRCPECSRRQTISHLHRKCIDYIRKDLREECNLEHDCTFRLINPDTGCRLPYDIELPEYGLLIEVQGEQHYNLLRDDHLFLHGSSSDEYLKHRQTIDRYKKEMALQNGYHFLEIPYQAEENDQFKILINQEISKIKGAES